MTRAFGMPAGSRRCRKKFTESSVHELRVETRRMLALIGLLEAAHLDPHLEKLRKTFKKRLDAFGDLRDTQVQLCLLKPMWSRFPEAKPFRKLLRQRERCLVKNLRHCVRRQKFGHQNRCLKSVEKLLACGRKGKAPHSALASLAVLRDAFGRVLDLKRQVRRADPATIHRMRIAFKGFRYMSELLEPFVPKFTRARFGQMQRYQAAAGNVQDAQMLLEGMARAVEDGEIENGAVRKLRNQFLRWRREKIVSFMSNIDQLMTFEPQ